MAKFEIKKGKTSKRIFVFIQDSSSTTGAGKTGLAWNSGGLTWTYSREDDGNTNAASVTLSTATKGSYTSGGFVEKDPAGAPGIYELGIPNAALASGSSHVSMLLFGATGMSPTPIEIQLVNVDPDDGNYGLTNLDAAITAVTTKLPSALVSGKIDASLGAVQSGVTLSSPKKNTAINSFEFPMVDAIDHVTGKTGLQGLITATRSIDGGAFAACTNTAVEVGNGIYKINLSAADLNGDTITLRFAATGADDTRVGILTQPT